MRKVGWVEGGRREARTKWGTYLCFGCAGSLGLTGAGRLDSFKRFLRRLVGRLVNTARLAELQMDVVSGVFFLFLFVLLLEYLG